MDRNQAATEIFNALIALCNREPAPRVQMRAQGESLVLHLLARHPDGMVAEEIRQIMDVSSARVAAILANLERKDLIIRLIEPEDRRRLRIMLTPAGQTHAGTRCIHHRPLRAVPGRPGRRGNSVLHSRPP